MAHSDKVKKHKPELFQPSLDQITVIDLVWFLRSLSDEEREKVVDLLRAIQDRRWREVWPEPIAGNGITNVPEVRGGHGRKMHTATRSLTHLWYTALNSDLAREGEG